jgi:2-phospho-L-lactate guanylyltransferase
MSCWALIALKSFACGKTRLAQVLPLPEREALSRRMLDQVVCALQAAHEVDGIAIVTQQAGPLPANVLPLPDPGGGLNAALASGARQLAAIGATELLVLHADLPLLAADEIDDFIVQARRTGLGLASDRIGHGTNAVFVAPPLAFDFCFGRYSFMRHRQQARERGLQPFVASAPGFAFDIDEPADLAALLAAHGEHFAPTLDAWKPMPWTTRLNDCSASPATQAD